MAVALQPKLVRERDRVGSAVWRINPRTGFVESKAGLSWTGVRQYRTPTGVVRVLRRPEQVRAPGHLRTLRMLPNTDGHPAGDVDVTPANEAQLRVGSVGDLIEMEMCGGYERPVGMLSVSRPETMVKIVDAETWAELCERFPDLAAIKHSGGDPATGNSLGYNALWWGPHVDAEIISERDDGSLVGAWTGPNGPEEYDIEHIIDPDCEIVQRLVREAGFDPSQLGGNHNATALQCLGGRGGAQTELMRIVDARDVALTPDMRRAASRTQHPAPKPKSKPTPTRDEQWTVGTDRDLPIVSAETWDGDAAAQSVFAWAGFDGDAPDPAKARRAFLIYDADAPELKGSYKLPIARYSSERSRLEVVASGLAAAASYLPQTNAPQEVLDRARTVLDSYYAKKDKMAGSARDGARRMTTNIEIGIGRDNFNKLAKLGVLTKLVDKGRSIPQTLVIPLPEAVTDMDMKAMIGKLEEMKGMFSDLIEMAGEAMGEAEDAMGEAEGAKEMKAQYDDLAAKIAAKEQELAAMKEQLAKEKEANGEMAAERDRLLAEVEPLRARELESLRDVAVKLGCDDDKVKSAKDAAEVRRQIATHKLGERYSETVGEGDAKQYRVSDEAIAGTIDGLLAGIRDAAGDDANAADPVRDYGAPFRLLPELKPHQTPDNKRPEGTQRGRDANTQDNDDKDPLLAGLAAAGG